MAPDGRRYTLVLTRGTHLIDARGLSVVLSAVESSHPFVEVPVDSSGDGVNYEKVIIVTRHIVEAIEHEESPADATVDFARFNGKVTPMR